MHHIIQPDVSEIGTNNCTGKSFPALWNSEKNAEIICIITNMDGIVTV